MEGRRVHLSSGVLPELDLRIESEIVSGIGYRSAKEDWNQERWHHDFLPGRGRAENGRRRGQLRIMARVSEHIDAMDRKPRSDRETRWVERAVLQLLPIPMGMVSSSQLQHPLGWRPYLWHSLHVSPKGLRLSLVHRSRSSEPTLAISETPNRSLPSGRWFPNS